MTEKLTEKVGNLTLHYFPRFKKTRKTRFYPIFATDTEVAEASGMSTEQLEYIPRGRKPEVDQAWDDWNRWVVKLTRPKVVEVARSFDGEAKLRFNRKAGCSCGCSPGFVADRVLEYEGKLIASVYM